MENSILKDAIKEISELTRRNTIITEIDGHHYIVNDDSYEEITPELPPLPKTLSFSSLDGFIKTVRCELHNILAATESGETLFISVCAHNRVAAFSGLDNYNRRPALYEATQPTANWSGEHWFEHEEAMIALQSRFEHNSGTEYLLDFLSRVTDENSVSSEDNGMTQSVQVKKGIALAARENIRPIVALKPYRTFMEVEQPESNFLIRIKDGCRVGIIEADGGMWQFKARNSVKEYLEAAFEKEISNGSIVVAL